MVTTLLAAASMLGGDDDEPWDAKVALQNLLADTFGQKPAEVLAHGLSRLTPWDILGRAGLDKLRWRLGGLRCRSRSQASDQEKRPRG